MLRDILIFFTTKSLTRSSTATKTMTSVNQVGMHIETDKSERMVLIKINYVYGLFYCDHKPLFGCYIVLFLTSKALSVPDWE